MMPRRRRHLPHPLLMRCSYQALHRHRRPPRRWCWHRPAAGPLVWTTVVLALVFLLLVRRQFLFLLQFAMLGCAVVHRFERVADKEAIGLHVVATGILPQLVQLDAKFAVGLR